MTTEPSSETGTDLVQFNFQDVPPFEISTEEVSLGAVPYMSFQSFRSHIDRLSTDGVPSVLDRSFFGNQSGSLTAQVRGTMKALGLITDDYHPTPLLHQIAEAPDESARVALLRELTKAKYEDALALGPRGTTGQLEDVFRKRGINGATIQKAISFYLGLTEYVGIETSQFFKTRGSSGTSMRRPVKRRKLAPAAVLTPPVPAAPPSPPDQKTAYVDLLMKLVQEAADPEVQKGLLDRIEKAIGVGIPHPGGGASD